MEPTKSQKEFVNSVRSKLGMRPEEEVEELSRVALVAHIFIDPGELEYVHRQVRKGARLAWVCVVFFTNEAISAFGFIGINSATRFKAYSVSAFAIIPL
jgi:hypothetical protein